MIQQVLIHCKIIDNGWLVMTAWCLPMNAEILKSITYQTSLRVDFTARMCKINKFIFNNKTLPICSLLYVLDLNIVDMEYDWNGDKDSFTVSVFVYVCKLENKGQYPSVDLHILGTTDA